MKLTWDEKKQFLDSIADEKFSSVGEAAEAALARCSSLFVARHLSLPTEELKSAVWTAVCDMLETLWLTDGKMPCTARRPVLSPTDDTQIPPVLSEEKPKLLYADEARRLWLLPVEGDKQHYQLVLRDARNRCQLSLPTGPLVTCSQAIEKAIEISEVLHFSPHQAVFAEDADLSSWRAGLFDCEGTLRIQADDELRSETEGDVGVLQQIIQAASRGDPRALRALYLDGRRTDDEQDLWKQAWLSEALQDA